MWCDKRCYLDKRAAQTMRNLRQRREGRKLYIYYCMKHKCWHLTKHKNGRHVTV